MKRVLIGMTLSTFGDTVEIASRIEGEDLEQARERIWKGKEGFRPPAHKRSG
jgi:hypothetical protein